MNKYATYQDLKRDTRVDHVAALNLLDITATELQELYDAMTPEEKDEFERLLRSSPPRALMPHQRVPLEQSWWSLMLLIGGRGVGKTVTGAYAVREHLRLYGKHARVGIGAPIVSDARDTCMEGETGLYTMFKGEFTRYSRSLGEAYHINGGYVKFMGTEEPKRWNGGNWTMLWFDELALCNELSWKDAMLALRVKGPNGERPYAVATTTPKNRKFVKDLAKDPTTYVPQYIDPITHKRRVPTTFDNGYLPQERVAWLNRQFGGTRQGQQELLGLFLDGVAGSMFDPKWFRHVEDMRLLPRMRRIVVAIDPAGSMARLRADMNSLSEEQKKNQESNCDTAIAVVGLGVDDNYYVIELKSGQWTPNEWAKEALRLFHFYRCHNLVAEVNFGGAMVEDTIRRTEFYDQEMRKKIDGRLAPVKLISASKGKHIRAQPVSNLYQQGRVRHAKVFGEGESQLAAFINADENEGADMVDAMVWGVLEVSGMADSFGSSMIVVPGDPRYRQMSNLIRTFR